MKNELPNRKAIRLKDFDYRQNGFYFITICTHDKKRIFGKITGNTMEMNQLGTIAFEELKSIEQHHKNAKVLNAVVMPNHVHIILEFDDKNPETTEIEYNEFGKPGHSTQCPYEGLAVPFS
jgi:REP element-mobilizing transposase RayT